ncbi:hypothetical protein ACMU_13775 [Actibacterium mucosum KCTC 23349]|uniref:UDP-N-acetylmuramate--alanine ligase n=1 Tax=Actibacterium mucosum KCTC 23349 TaxID=1454373 RepID=A0A037ZLN5_9RHOB|nr:DUF2484 family protein [Actibacterium mucosum]KAJ55751.1 hypothetical protein ACMU_13775 [Actibacterium mucosum KCTC 23349]
MTYSLIVAFIWVLAATVTAWMPMRIQVRVGWPLLLSAPLVIGYLGYELGIWVGVAAAAGFVSMFRNPLVYLTKRALGRVPPFDPKEHEP